jgi:hypothetical protein
MRAKRWILLGVAVIFTAFGAWVVVSLRNHDSTLSLVASYVQRATCWPADSSVACEFDAELKTMEKYRKKARYDDAISTGIAWTEKYPDSSMNGWIYEDISMLYLRKARTDSGRAEEYLRMAVLYRDKAVPSASDNSYLLQQLALVSESIGDLSTAQRCVQYRNSIKLLDRMKLLENENQDRLARQFKPDLDERQKADHLLEYIDKVIKRVGGKLSAPSCQEQTHFPG